MLMKILGIVAEYNPFHNGHLYHLEKSKETSGCSHTIAIMSGSFLQRGEPALTDKWNRAKTAVKNGIDLVVELPYAYSCQSAEIFAYGAIRTLNDTKSVNCLAFGSESADISKLSLVADIIAKEPEDYKDKLRKNLQTGLSFPKARELALNSCIPNVGESVVIGLPNNILALEYLKWISRLESNIEPIPIERAKVGYHSDFSLDGIASATHIRNIINQNDQWKEILKPLVPQITYEEIESYSNKQAFNNLENYFDIIASEILKSSPKEISVYPDVTEGLENRLVSSLKNSSTVAGLVEEVSSKRYPSTRISRILCHMATHFTDEDNALFYKDKSFNPYLRILAFNTKGREIINAIKDHSEIKILDNLGRSQKKLELNQVRCLKKDIAASDIYFLKTNPQKIGSDYFKKPIYINE